MNSTFYCCLTITRSFPTFVLEGCPDNKSFVVAWDLYNVLFLNDDIIFLETYETCIYILWRVSNYTVILKSYPSYEIFLKNFKIKICFKFVTVRMTLGLQSLSQYHRVFNLLFFCIEISLPLSVPETITRFPHTNKKNQEA